MNRPKTWPILLLAALSCGEPSTSTTDQMPTHAASVAVAVPVPAPVAEGPWEDEPPPAKFDDGARAFTKVKETLLANYYADGVTEDDIYRAATAGMLERLDPKMKKWNRLMSARELAEMKNDLTGEVVGIGVHISFDSKSGHAEVLATLPGSPSEKAGLAAGDRIVTVNGKLYKDATLRQVVEDIRGKAGEPVTLSVLRGDKLVPFTVHRARVPFDTPAALFLDGGVGYVRIPSFTDKTPSAVRSALDDLAKQKVQALILDLRGCPGGSFDRAVETAGALLPEGAPVVALKRRGKAEEKHVAKGGGVLVDLPLAVLVDGNTGSSAELVAAALSEDRHARIVGAKTLGKWTVQSVDELSNGWAFKYTVSLFKTPSGRSFEGVGLTPDVEVAMDEKQLAKANATPKPEDRLAIDVQLKTAKELLVRRP